MYAGFDEECLRAVNDIRVLFTFVCFRLRKQTFFLGKCRRSSCAEERSAFLHGHGKSGGMNVTDQEFNAYA